MKQLIKANYKLDKKKHTFIIYEWFLCLDFKVWLCVNEYNPKTIAIKVYHDYFSII